MKNENIGKAELAELRLSVDRLDKALIQILAERFVVTKKIGMLKAEYHLPSFDGERQAKQNETFAILAQEVGLNPTFVQSLFEFIAQEVIQNHEAIKTNRYQNRP